MMAALSGEEEGLCRYGGYLCHRERLKHYDFCLRHILEDKTAPFKQCTYNIKSQKRCLRPAPRADKKDGYCAEHARKAQSNRHQLLSKKKHVELSSRCLSDLSHHGGVPSTSSVSPLVPPPLALGEEATITLRNDASFPPKPYGILSRVNAVSSVVEGGEALSQADEEDVRVDQTWKGDCESDTESLDCPLSQAGVYAPEEVVRIMKDQLVRLQKAYIDQFGRLQYLLREERRRYKHALAQEKESLMSIHVQPKDSESERRAYGLLKSLNHYHRRQGKDAFIASKVREKRRRLSEGSTSSSSNSGPKCTFSITSHIKCSEPCIPLSKFCLKHVLQDPAQVLFRPCGFITPADDEPCESPVANSFDESTCVYHTFLPTPISKREPLIAFPKKEEILPEWCLPSVKDVDDKPPPCMTELPAHQENKEDTFLPAAGVMLKEEDVLDKNPSIERPSQEQETLTTASSSPQKEDSSVPTKSSSTL
eukprot:TRINITY_DN921_c0_g1_i1.p1 TRINITY_DN921_c0_g1~~TRINITY_DN921_c0_g1_i1.p1  ORF type:complete len:480 (-),score=126.30 TRINITY_DN921_c0_g1_i1:839-2278(-)